MSCSVDDFQSISPVETFDVKRQRRQAMATLVQALADVSRDLSDQGNLKHRAAITQLTTIIGNVTTGIAEADDPAFMAIVTEATALVDGAARRSGNGWGNVALICDRDDMPRNEMASRQGVTDVL